MLAIVVAGLLWSILPAIHVWTAHGGETAAACWASVGGEARADADRCDRAASGHAAGLAAPDAEHGDRPAHRHDACGVCGLLGLTGSWGAAGPPAAAGLAVAVRMDGEIGECERRVQQCWHAPVTVTGPPSERA